MEQLTVQFTTMLGSAAKAAGFMEKLRTYAASSPFDMKGGAEATSILLGFGLSAERSMAGMVTLGGTLYNVEAPELSAVSHGRLMRTWYLPAASADGKWQREQVMALWNDVAWCSRADNESPIAAMSDCMWNLKYIRAQNGGKTAFICADAGQSVWDKAEKFLE